MAAGALMGFMGFSHVITSNPELKSHAANFANFMRDNPWKGAAAHSVLSILITTSGIPFSLVDLAAAWVYPTPIAMCMLLFAKTVGSLFCYLIANNVLSEKRKADLLGNKTLKRLNKILSGRPIYYGTLARLAYMPAFVKNYGLGLLDIDLPRFLVCCLLGSVIGVPTQAYLGAKLGAFYLGLQDASQLDDAAAVSALGGIFAVVSLIVLAQYVARQLIGQDDDEKTEEKTSEKND